MGNLEIEGWKNFWNKRGKEISDLHWCVRGAPDLLSGKTRGWNWEQVTCSLELKPTDVFVDAGCGVGDSILSIGKCNLVLGMDLAEDILKLAKARVEHLDNHVVLISGSITDFPLHDETISGNYFLFC